MKNKQDNAMVKWIGIQTIAITLFALISYLVVELLGYAIWKIEIKDIVPKIFGMLFIMLVFFTFYNIYIARSSYKHIGDLTHGIKRIANGDFDYKIDTKQAKAMNEVYENVNLLGEELKNIQMLRNDFVNSYSHEFKTPISSINGFAELLLKTQVSEQDRKNYLQIIFDESARLANLASSTILLSKLDSQLIIENKRFYSLDEQIRETSVVFLNEWKKKEINMSGNLDEITYNGNEDIMRHLWQNLISNAVKFTPVGGDIQITLQKLNGKIVFSVIDSGKGMTQEQIDHIFDKYYQSDKSGSNAGLGLGLNITKRIVLLCGGKIEVESVIGQGSTFIVTLPVA